MYELEFFNIYPNSIKSVTGDVNYAIEIFDLDDDEVWERIRDDYENGDIVELSDLTNSIIGVCYYNLQSVIENEYHLNCDYFVNGDDSHFYVNDTEIVSLDRETAQMLISGEYVDEIE